MDGRWPSSGQRTTDIGQRMNINRHNYEEFFILYMDNELCSDDRRMVEAFVLPHPDRKEEFVLLLQFKLSPDTEILFPGKEELIKTNGETPVTLNNYEEWLILYTDNELNAEQRNAVERFIATNPSVKEELALLQRTKLQPEQIVFANKQSLYRREEKVRVLPMHWWRAAAAVLILALGLSAVLVLNNKPTVVKDGVANNQPVLKEKNSDAKSLVKTNSESPVVAPVKKENTPVNETAVADNVNQSFTPVVKQNNKNNVVKNNGRIIKEKTPVNIPLPVKKEEPVIVDNNNKPSNNLPQPLNNPSINKNNVTTDVVAKNNLLKEVTNPQESLTTDRVTNIIPASYTNNNNDADQLEEGGKNKKNRGFLRKLTRTFEKRTNMTATDDDKLLVGGLAFKLK
jgi:hypothetical protein